MMVAGNWVSFHGERLNQKFKQCLTECLTLKFLGATCGLDINVCLNIELFSITSDSSN